MEDGILDVLKNLDKLGPAAIAIVVLIVLVPVIKAIIELFSDDKNNNKIENSPNAKIVNGDDNSKN